MHTGEFDFWIGRWRGTWDGEDGPGSATNDVSKAYKDNVVLEQFTADPPDDFAGMSVSVYDGRAQAWKQTWVDNTGAYLDFEGGMVDDELRLTRTVTIDGQKILQRMVWTDIADDRFEWFWLRSPDGAEWKPVWHISYERLA